MLARVAAFLSFFAAESGASKVYAVEVEPFLAQKLRESVNLNGLTEVVEVMQGDIREVCLPGGVDVVIAEIIETGLLDELQVQALNSLRKNGTINAKTRLIPDGYRTSAQLVYTDNLYYGYQIAAPKHEWPFYARSSDERFPTHFDIASDTVEITSIDFASGAINERVDRIVRFI